MSNEWIEKGGGIFTGYVSEPRLQECLQELNEERISGAIKNFRVAQVSGTLEHRDSFIYQIYFERNI